MRTEKSGSNVISHDDGLPYKVSVHCVERGEVLAELRRRYSNLLDRIPFQVKRLAIFHLIPFHFIMYATVQRTGLNCVDNHCVYVIFH